VVSSLSVGGLIQEPVGNDGGSGGLRTNRSGWAAKAVVSTPARLSRTAAASLAQLLTPRNLD